MPKFRFAKLISSIVASTMLLTIAAWAAQSTVPSVGPVESNKYPLATSITENGTTTPVKGMTGYKSFWGEVVCSAGACTQTQAIYGDIDGDGANGVLLCTITLSATPRHQDACPPVVTNFSYYYVVVTNTTGTSATGAVYAIH